MAKFFTPALMMIIELPGDSSSLSRSTPTHETSGRAQAETDSPGDTLDQTAG